MIAPFEHRELLYNLVEREIKIRYKQSVLGILWVIIQPLFMMIIFTVVFSHFAKIQSDGIPYPIFSYCALLPWYFFSGALSTAVPSIVNNADLVRKIYFPREIFPLASILAAGVDFLVASVLFALMLFFYHIGLSWMALWVIPLMLIQIIFTVALALAASALNVRFRDVRYVFTFLLQIWMYVSPVIYPLSAVPENIKGIYILNPMSILIDGYRKVLLIGQAPNLKYVAIATLISLLLFIFSYLYFKKTEGDFADII